MAVLSWSTFELPMKDGSQANSKALLDALEVRTFFTGSESLGLKSAPSHVMPSAILVFFLMTSTAPDAQ